MQIEMAKYYVEFFEPFFKVEIHENQEKGALWYKQNNSIHNCSKQWNRGLKREQLKPMAKTLGQIIATTTHLDELNPILFTA